MKIAATFLIGLTAALSSSPVRGWVVMMAPKNSAKTTFLQADLFSRRQTIQTVLGGIISVGFADGSFAENAPDPLDAFGKDLSMGKWSESFSSPTGNSGTTASNQGDKQGQMSDLERAVKDAEKKKRIDPRTHG